MAKGSGSTRKSTPATMYPGGGYGYSGGSGGGFGNAKIEIELVSPEEMEKRELDAKVLKVLTDKEAQFRKYKVEHGAVVDPKTGAVTWEGTNNKRNQVAILGNKNGMIVTHNHPNGSSFSPADIMVAAFNNVAEMRATGQYYTFSVKPKDGKGWPTAITSVKTFKSRVRSIEKKVVARLQNSSRWTKMGMQELNLVASHMVNKEVAKFYGLEYSRTKTK